MHQTAWVAMGVGGAVLAGSIRWILGAVSRDRALRATLVTDTNAALRAVATAHGLTCEEPPSLAHPVVGAVPVFATARGVLGGLTVTVHTTGEMDEDTDLATRVVVTAPAGRHFGAASWRASVDRHGVNLRGASDALTRVLEASLAAWPRTPAVTLEARGSTLTATATVTPPEGAPRGVFFRSRLVAQPADLDALLRRVHTLGTRLLDPV